MAAYTLITRDEMAGLLEPQGFHPMQLQGTLEALWGKRADKGGIAYSIRVYSSINPNGTGRDVGKDAIRVEVWTRTAAGKLRRVGGSKRVHRVEGWRSNLQQRLDHWAEHLGPACPLCGEATALREPQGNATWAAFYGCCDYPDCKGTGGTQKGVEQPKSKPTGRKAEKNNKKKDLQHRIEEQAAEAEVWMLEGMQE